jgi:hypothetical protein
MSSVTVGLLFGLVRFVVLRGLAMLIQSAIVRELKVHVVPQARPDFNGTELNNYVDSIPIV